MFQVGATDDEEEEEEGLSFIISYVSTCYLAYKFPSYYALKSS
jgi:hypothetical protein